MKRDEEEVGIHERRGRGRGRELTSGHPFLEAASPFQ